MTICQVPIRCKLVIDNNIIEHISNFQYLSTNITSYGCLNEEVLLQNNKANRISECLRDTIWSNKYLRTDAKVRIYKSIIRPILAYKAKKLGPIQQRNKWNENFKTVAIKTIRDRIRNEKIREELKIDQIAEWIKIRKDEWNEHKLHGQQ